MLEQITRFLELPQEIIYNLPKVTLVGNLQVLIENHQGIIEYSAGKIRISINIGEIEVLGKELSIRNITRDEICLEGEVFGLNYQR